MVSFRQNKGELKSPTKKKTRRYKGVNPKSKTVMYFKFIIIYNNNYKRLEFFIFSFIKWNDLLTPPFKWLEI